MLRRLLLYLFAVGVFLLLVPSLHARERIAGWCEQGGNTLTVAGLETTDTAQQSFPGCTVTVWDAGTVDIASIFSDDVGTIKANPFTADGTTGLWSFYADNARYDVQLSGGGIATPFTLADFLADDTAQTITTAVLNDINWVDGNKFITEQAAVDDFSTDRGLVVVPSTYVGADATSIPVNVTVIKLDQATAGIQLRVGRSTGRASIEAANNTTLDLRTFCTGGSDGSAGNNCRGIASRTNYDGDERAEAFSGGVDYSGGGGGSPTLGEVGIFIGDIQSSGGGSSFGIHTGITTTADPTSTAQERAAVFEIERNVVVAGGAFSRGVEVTSTGTQTASDAIFIGGSGGWVRGIHFNVVPSGQYINFVAGHISGSTVALRIKGGGTSNSLILMGRTDAAAGGLVNIREGDDTPIASFSAGVIVFAPRLQWDTAPSEYLRFEAGHISGSAVALRVKGGGSSNSLVLMGRTDNAAGGLVSVREGDDTVIVDFSGTGTKFSQGINTDGSGFKHAHITTGSISSSSSAAVVVTWGTAFADTNYTVTCSVVEADTDTATLQIDHIEAVVAASVTVRVENENAGAARTGTLHCMAVHSQV